MIIKRAFLFSVFNSLLLVGFGQTILPTSWDADGDPPFAWSTSGTGKYANNGNDSRPSISFKGTGQRVDVFVSDVPGEVSFYLKGQTFNGADFEGTFEVQESEDGQNFTTGISISGSDLPASGFTRYAFDAQETTKYLRFIHTNKVSGSNVACDDILISRASPAGPDFNVVDLGNRIANNGEILFEGEIDTRVIGLVNMGGSNLSITSSTLTLNEGNSFSLSPINDLASIAPGDTGKLEISFQPPTLEQYLGTIEFTSNQDFKSPFLLNLNGLGGATANEPNNAPFSLQTNNTSTFRTQLRYTGSDAESYLVVLAEAPLSGEPVDGRSYDLSERIGNGKVVYNGSASSCTINNLVANSNYYVQVFPFNGEGTQCNYKTNGLPPTKTFATPANMITQGYYDGVDPNNPSFLGDLFNVVNPHTQQFYDNYDEIMVAQFLAKDTTNGERFVEGAYSGFLYKYQPPFNFAVMSREHTYSFSWMPHSDEEAVSYSDYHNLLLVHQNGANAPRSNYPLGRVVTATSTFLQGKLGTDQGGNIVYEPRDEFKGDAARAQMYMAVAYNGMDGENWALPDNISNRGYGVDQNLLKEWNRIDPPSNFEISRNDFIDSLQGNRNPFVDNPDWACYIDFIEMQYINNPNSGCFVTSISEEQGYQNLKLTPNPVSAKQQFNISLPSAWQGTVTLMDVSGKTLLQKTYSGQQNKLSLEAPSIPGIYFLQQQNSTGNTHIAKLLVQ